MRAPWALAALLATVASVPMASAQQSAPPTAPAASTVELTPADILQIAAQAARAGDFATARRFAEALLQRNPAEPSALTLLAQAAFETGDFPAARTAAARLYRTPSLPAAQRYSAARLAALASLNEGRMTLSQLWLRRALIVAPTPEDTAQTERDAADVRRRNPWSFDVELAFAPSTNVNGGSATEEFTIDGPGLPTFAFGESSIAAQALSGWTASADIRATYRLFATETSRTTAGARVALRGGFLSPASRDRLAASENENDHALDNGDLTSLSTEFRLAHDFAVNRGAAGLEAAFGAVWTQGDFAYTFGRLSANRSFRFDDSNSLRAALTFDDRFTTSDRYPDQQRYVIQTMWIHTLADGSGLISSLGYTQTDNEDRNLAGHSIDARLVYKPSYRIGPAEMAFTFEAQRFEAPDYQFRVFNILFQTPRIDTTYSINVDAFFPDMSYAGFAPALTLDIGQTNSNVSRYDSTAYGIGLNFRSTF